MRTLPFSLAVILSASALASKPDPRGAFHQLPAWFEPSPGGKSFSSRTAAVSLFVDPRGASLAAAAGTIRMDFAGARPDASFVPLELRPGVSNYITGNDRRAWRSKVPQFSRVQLRGVYPGVDVVYYSAGKTLEYDLVLAPGADPAAVRLRFPHTRASLQPNGDLLLSTASLKLRQHAPVAYQLRAGARIPVESAYRLLPSGEIAFRLGAYDRDLPLVIDPVVSWVGYLGWDQTDVVNAVLADPDGGFWFAGGAFSHRPIPDGTSPYQTDKKGAKDAFIAKIVPDGASWKLAYWSYIGGGADDEATSIAWLGFRLAITGTTTSTNFPLGGASIQTTHAGADDAFVVLYDPLASGLDCMTYSTYFGGPGSEFPQSVAADRRGNLAITGYTNSGELKGATAGTVYQPSNRGGLDAFVAVFRPLEANAADTLILSTFYGGNSSDLGNAVAIAPNGLVYVTGTTMSWDLPLAGPSYQPDLRASGDLFLAIFDASKSKFDQVVYSTYIGGYGLDSAQALAVDAQNRAWITGYTSSTDLPVSPGAYQLAVAGGFDSFLIRVDPSKTGADFISYCTYLGGKGTDVAYGLALNPADGTVTVAGYSTSADFPAVNVAGFVQPSIRQAEAFASRIDPSKSGPTSLVWSTLFGGPGMDVATGVALDDSGNAVVGGFTNSFDLQLGDAIGKMSPAGYYSGFFFRLSDK
ncbi:MAG: SBBP repeat-containing protein [Acidobacteria bacterium]|nr:SBBP repeat-containing protein [Acidobacteriota bacterium]